MKVISIFCSRQKSGECLDVYANVRAVYHPTRNRENGTQQQFKTLGQPKPNALHTHEAVAKQDVPQITQHKSEDRSSVTQEKKTRKQGLDSMSSQHSWVSQPL